MLSSSDILVLTLVGVLALAFLVFAGLALSVRSFTVLTELIQSLGLQVVAKHQETQQALTTLSADVAREVSSAVTNGSHSTLAEPGYQDDSRGISETK